MNKQSGFTLIEIIVATAILAVGIVAVLNMFPLGIQIAGFSQRTTTAVYLAQAKMEEQASKSYFSLTVSSVAEDYGAIPEFPGYKRTTSISCLNASDLSAVNCGYDPVNDSYPMKKISVEVFWRSFFEPEKSVGLSNIISRR